MHGFGRIRGPVTGVAVGAALLLGGCSSSGTIGATGTPAGVGTGSRTSTGAGAPQSCRPTPANADCGVYNGTWKGTTDGAPVTLTVAKDKAELKTPHDCPGSFDGRLLMLTCQDGDSDRQTGDVTLSSDHKTLTVSWDAGITDTLTKG